MISYKSVHVQVCCLKCLNRQVGITFIHFALYVSPINNTNLTPQSLFFSHMFSENYRAAHLFSNHLSYIAGPQQQARRILSQQFRVYGECLLISQCLSEMFSLYISYCSVLHQFVESFTDVREVASEGAAGLV